jgi:hypothetical protein
VAALSDICGGMSPTSSTGHTIVKWGKARCPPLHPRGWRWLRELVGINLGKVWIEFEEKRFDGQDTLRMDLADTGFGQAERLGNLA